MSTGTVANSNLTSLYSNTTSFTSGIVNSSVYSVNGGTGVTVTPTTGNVVVSIGQSVATSASPTFVNLTLTGDLTVTDEISASSITIDNKSTIETFTTTTTSTATVLLANTARTAMTVLVTAVQGANVHCVNVTLLKTGASTAMITTYGEMFNTSSLVSFTADVSAGLARLLITPASATSTVFNAVRTSLD
jgi:hypothetical protein